MARTEAAKQDARGDFVTLAQKDSHTTARLLVRRICRCDYFQRAKLPGEEAKYPIHNHYSTARLQWTIMSIVLNFMDCNSMPTLNRSRSDCTGSAITEQRHAICKP